MSKFTKKAITTAFMELLEKKSLDKITVKDIIEAAEINRNTFYYHYQDIYDLIEQIFQDELIRMDEETEVNKSFYEEFVRTCELVYERRDAVYHIYHSKSRDIFYRYLQSAVKHFVERFVKEAAAGKKLSEEGISYIVGFYSSAIIGSTLSWIESGRADEKEKLIRTISDSFEATVDQMIETYMMDHPEK